MLLAPVPATAAAPPRFTSPDALSSDSGHAAVEWQADGPVTLEMTQDGNAAPRVLYSGHNHSLFISGLANGTYRLRLTDAAGQSSPPLLLTVAHQSLSRALMLVALGAVIFLSIVAVIFRGARDE
ncbi:hypothetical protein [Novosphingobium beihaiensis]|uniref:Two component regulator three Y domain-containing protein n=1 Tax=Novosphingobium beihaiensis TaxID=2930389 RepID=A0ABT0BPA2_9SPHN|nr:hypothetical protein [Novosphingobium beihaiensis]MCJ2186883.1 hypothetical protein [Novosphingobium beihaiensis]